MGTTSRRKWLACSLAIGFSVSAAISYFGYMGNGITAGSLIGLPGRESDVVKAQHYARLFLAAAAVFQAGVAAGLYFLFDFELDLPRLSRFAARCCIAVLASFLFTFLVTAMIEAGMRLFGSTH